MYWSNAFIWRKSLGSKEKVHHPIPTALNGHNSTRFCPSELNLELNSALFDSAHDSNSTGMQKIFSLVHDKDDACTQMTHMYILCVHAHPKHREIYMHVSKYRLVGLTNMLWTNRQYSEQWAWNLVSTRPVMSHVHPQIYNWIWWVWIGYLTFCWHTTMEVD